LYSVVALCYFLEFSHQTLPLQLVCLQQSNGRSATICRLYDSLLITSKYHVPAVPFSTENSPTLHFKCKVILVQHSDICGTLGLLLSNVDV